MTIHRVSRASQGDITIGCNQSNESAAWKQNTSNPPGIHNTEQGNFYSFNRDKVTCLLCLKHYEIQGNV